MSTVIYTATAPYSPNIFDTIPDLGPANSKFEELGGLAWVNEVGKDLLMRYGMNNTSGIQLLHRHFDIDEKEILVEFNNVTIPWLNDGKSDGKYKGFSPTAWKLVREVQGDGRNLTWMPYEFSYHPSPHTASTVDLNDPKYAAFLEAYAVALVSAGLDQVIGLNVMAAPEVRGGLEFGEGKANILLHPGQFNAEEDKTAVEAAWYFPDGQQIGRHCKIRCSRIAYGPHVKKHIPQGGGW